MYLHLLISILEMGHSWPVPLDPVFWDGTGDEFVPDYLLCLQIRLRGATYLERLDAVPMSWPRADLAETMLASRVHISMLRMFFLTNAGIGLYGQRDGLRPFWVPDYDAIARLPERVPSSFEIEVSWSQKHYGCDFRYRRLEVLGSREGKIDKVQQIPEPGDIADLFGFLRKLPENEVGPLNEKAILRVKSTLEAMHLDRRRSPVNAAFHRCVGTLLLTPQEDSNPLLRLLGISQSDEVMDKANRVRDVLFPDVGKDVGDKYIPGWAAGAARQLTADPDQGSGEVL